MGKSEEGRLARAAGEKGEALAKIAIVSCLIGFTSVAFRVVRVVGVGAAVAVGGLCRRRGGSRPPDGASGNAGEVGR